MKLPNFLLEMSKQLNEQDNRCTADPIWVVCYDEWLTCANDRGDKTQLLISDGDSWDTFDDVEEFISHMLENKNENSEMDLLAQGDECDSIKDMFNDFNDVMAYEYDLGLESIEVLDMQKVVHKVKYCMTESDANAFIKRKQHDYARLYTYVESMYHCPQMIELRNWIKGLDHVS